MYSCLKLPEGLFIPKLVGVVDDIIPKGLPRPVAAVFAPPPKGFDPKVDWQ